MLDKPANWEKYYPGTALHQRLQRHFSYSDRIRYYWNEDIARKAVAALLALFGDTAVPEPLISQYLGASYAQVMTGASAPTARSLIRTSLIRVLSDYSAACGQPASA